jgi:threonine/homoserine/homoserine lactone efflux protein
MDLGIAGALALLVAWALGTWFAEPPGWFHLLLTAGVFLLLWRIIVRGTPRGPSR